MSVEVVVDGDLQFDDGMEQVATDALCADLREKGLNYIEPGYPCRRGMHVNGRMPNHPRLDLEAIASGLVVGDKMDAEIWRDFLVDSVEEADELLVPMLLHALADHPTVKHIERSTTPRTQGEECASEAYERAGLLNADVHYATQSDSRQKFNLGGFLGRCCVLASGYTVIFAAPALAYLDPGTGSIILQGLLAFIATVVATGGIFWQRLKVKFNLWFSRKQSSNIEKNQDPEK